VDELAQATDSPNSRSQHASQYTSGSSSQVRLSRNAGLSAASSRPCDQRHTRCVTVVPETGEVLSGSRRVGMDENYRMLGREREATIGGNPMTEEHSQNEQTDLELDPATLRSLTVFMLPAARPRPTPPGTADREGAGGMASGQRERLI